MAIDDEYHALTKNKMRDLVPRLLGVNVIQLMWIFAHKFKSNGAS